VTIVDGEAAEMALVRDYLGRLRAAGWGLAPARRDELVGEVGEHIEQALRTENQAGRHGEAVVRNVLDRLGPPEDIVRAETEGQPYDAGGAAMPGRAPSDPPPPPGHPATSYGAAALWGPVEVCALLLLSVGSVVLPTVGPIAGIVLVWVSDKWTAPQKTLGTLLGLLPVLWFPLAFLGGFNF
jgi:hypothetical protein